MNRPLTGATLCFFFGLGVGIYATADNSTTAATTTSSPLVPRAEPAPLTLDEVCPPMHNVDLPLAGPYHKDYQNPNPANDPCGLF